MEEEKLTCASCGAKLKGDYCRKCGEKRIVPERDFSIGKFLNQSLWHFIHFDSKLLRSCWLLFIQPGFLTAEWIAGRRVGYMKPMQMFLVASVFFYFFLPTTLAHFTGYRDLVHGYNEPDYLQNTFHYDVERAFTSQLKAWNISEENLEDLLVKSASKHSKTWLFLIIPLWGMAIYLFFNNKIPWLVPHFIFAMHCLTFYILLDLSIHAVMIIPVIPNVGRGVFTILMTLFPIYQLLAVRRVYGSSWLVTVLKTAGIAVVFTVILLLYRQVMTIVGLWSL